VLNPGAPTTALRESIRAYWNAHIHDLSITQHAVGTPRFFRDLDEYRFEKLAYLQPILDAPRWRGQRVLDVGCGVGTDLVRLGRAGAMLTGVDLSTVAIELARQNLTQQGLSADVRVSDGEELTFASDSFDVVYAHGVLQYTADPRAMVREMYRVLRPGGQLVAMVYNRNSWLGLLALITRVELEHGDAPVLRMFSSREARDLFRAFRGLTVVPERFPVKTRLHHGLKAVLYNEVFVAGFRRLPRALVRPLGWHLMVYGSK
jgi:SAM-dependent methyltransferase